MKLTVIIRDDAPVIFCQALPSYRRVTFDLTAEQAKMIELKKTGSNGGEDFFEQVSQCILEME